MELCLVLNRNDELEDADNPTLNHAHAALVGDDPDGVHASRFKNLSLSAKKYLVQALIQQHCNLTGEDFAIIDLPENISNQFVMSLVGESGRKKATSKRSDTPTEESSTIRQVVSGTDPNTVYKVTVQGLKATSCECMGYRYYKTCKHVEKVQKELDEKY